MSSEITENELIQLVLEYYGIDEMPDDLSVGKLQNTNIWLVSFHMPILSDGIVQDYMEYMATVDPITREVKPEYLL